MSFLGAFSYLKKQTNLALFLGAATNYFNDLVVVRKS